MKRIRSVLVALAAMTLVLTSVGSVSAAKPATYSFSLASVTSDSATFSVNRSVTSGDVAWVFVDCNEVSYTEARPVIWGMWYSLTGTATVPASGSCIATLTLTPWGTKRNDPTISFSTSSSMLRAAAAPQPSASGTLSLVTPEPMYQKDLTFDWTVAGKYKAFYYPMLYVACYQSGNPYAYTTLPPNADGEYMVYGRLERIDYTGAKSGTYTSVLADGSSAYTWWVSEGGSKVSSCTATLYLYPGMHDAPIIRLDSTDFEVTG